MKSLNWTWRGSKVMMKPVRRFWRTYLLRMPVSRACINSLFHCSWLTEKVRFTIQNAKGGLKWSTLAEAMVEHGIYLNCNYLYMQYTSSPNQPNYVYPTHSNGFHPQGQNMMDRSPFSHLMPQNGFPAYFNQGNPQNQQSGLYLQVEADGEGTQVQKLH